MTNQDILSGVVAAAGNAFVNLTPDELIQKALERNEGILTDRGALAADTGEFTGRSPKDKFTVADAKTEDTVWWGPVNTKFESSKFDSLLNKVIEQVGDGRSFSKALIRNGAFPPLLIDMISVGEQTGKIDQSLRRAAERYDKELDKDLQRIMALVMPVVLIIMAGLIGTMAYLMITSIFQTISNIH